jgi:hypothetical protein
MTNELDFLGASLVEKLKTANKRQRRFVFTDITKKELLVGLKDNLEKAFDATGELKYSWVVGTNSYDVALMKTPQQLPLKTGIGKGGMTWNKTTLKYGPDFKRFVGVFLSEEQFKQLVEDQTYVVIGYLRKGEYNGKPNLTLNLHEMIPLAEVNNELVKLREQGL